MATVIDGRLRVLLTLLMTYLLAQVGTRIAMLMLTESISLNPPELLKTFGFGLIYDITAWSVIAIPLALILSTRRDRLISVSVFFFDFVTVLVAVTLVLFFREFGTNFNFIAVDYLIYSHELLGNIWQSFNIPLIMIAIFLVTVAIYNLQSRFLKIGRSHIGLLNFALIILIPLVTVPIVQSEWRDFVSSNRYNVETAGNGYYEFVRAYFTNELDYETFYMTKENVNLDVVSRVDNNNELSNVRPNVVIVTVESLNAEYLSMFGGTGLTPRLDALVDKSYVFTRMYATGTRTVRGLEAITLSLPPTPGQSIVRRKDNDNLSSLGDAFRQNGYERDFIYGGYGYFDNMNAFFEGNGYTIKDRTSIPDNEIIHETIWGVADEVLFTQVLKSMDDHFAKGEQALEMVMTTSNHRPFTFPEGRIDMPSGTRNASVKYTDWAIGDFLERAATKPWFDNTIFVIVADHQALAAGKATLPVNCYHIPCLIYSPKLIESGKCERLISQMDLAPTLLGMLGLPYEEKFLGHDINRVTETEDRAFISTYQLLGYVKNDTLTILSPDKKATAWHIDDWQTSEYSSLEADSALLDEAVAYYQTAAYLFKSGQLKKQ
ncbi:MAG: LTA synthase family protein [Selenomonadaceae bacterium]|nr:LTA synthase family protein [Selenomonadaceae bacterium]